KSWRRSEIRDPAALLAHEQGHFDLNEIKAVTLRRMPLAEYPSGSGATREAAVEDLRAKMQRFFDAAIADLQREHDHYDEETHHGQIAEKQKEWSETIEKRLRELRIQ